MTYTKKILQNNEWVTVDPKSITENGITDTTDVKAVDVDISGGGSLDYPTFTADGETQEITCDKTYSECATLCENSEIAENEWFCKLSPSFIGTMNLISEGAYIQVDLAHSGSVTSIYYLEDGTITMEQPK